MKVNDEHPRLVYFEYGAGMGDILTSEFCILYSVFCILVP
jgi:hypothetical protein